MIILDFSGGNNCKNEWPIAKRMIDALAEIDAQRKCVIKWQLFNEAGQNIPLDPDIFKMAYEYAGRYGFKTTASVFDLDSLRFLLLFDVPFVKIANRQDLYWLILEVPRKIPVFVSFPQNSEYPDYGFIKSVCGSEMEKWLCCVSDYPAMIKDYDLRFSYIALRTAISDHTTDWQLYRKYNPVIYECHFKLPDSEGLDSGPFARTPTQMRDIL